MSQDGGLRGDKEADNVLVVAVYVVVLDAVFLSITYPRLTGMDFAYADAIGDTDYVLRTCTAPWPPQIKLPRQLIPRAEIASHKNNRREIRREKRVINPIVGCDNMLN